MSETQHLDEWIEERTRRKILLMVDDDSNLRKVFREYMDDFHCEFIEAADGDEGLRLFRERDPDFIFLDLRLPKMDGIALFAIIKHEKPHQAMAILSGYLDDDARATLDAIGYAAKIDKARELRGPFVTNLLLTFGIPTKKPKNGDTEHYVRREAS